MAIHTLFKIPLTSAAGQWCRFAAIILFALCFVGVSGAAVIKFGEIKPPIASTGQGFLGNDFEVTPYARYAARNDGQLGLSPSRRIQMQGGRQLQANLPQVVITLQAKNIQVRAKWQVSNAINAFAMDEYGSGALSLTADINNIVTLDVTVYLEDDFKLLNSAYDNLMVAATIRVEIMLRTISIINLPLLYAAAGVAEIVHIFLPQGGKKPYQYITPSNIPSGFTYENGTLSIQANAVEGEYRLTVEIADAHNVIFMAVATVTVESSHTIEVQNGGAVFISQGQEQSIADGMMLKFNPKSSSGVLVSATAESTVALMAPGNAWAITIYGGSQASFVGNGNGAVVVSLEGDSDFVRDTAVGAEVSLAYVFRRVGVVEAIVPIMPTGTRIFSRSQGGEWYLVIDEGTAQFAPRGGVNFLALNDAEWLDGQTPIKAQEFKFDDFMIATVAHRYTGDVGSVVANYGVAPSFSLTNGAALVSDRIGTQYYPRHSVKVAVEGPQGPLTLSLPVVAEDRLGDMLGGYGYTNRLATVIATVVVGAPPVANFVGSSNVIYGPDAAAGKGATISITLSYPPPADHSVSLFVNSDTGDYTIKVLSSAGISCENEHCSLLIPAGQTLAQLSVLTGTDISLSIVASDGEFVVRVEVTAPVVEAPPVANFVGSSNVIYGSDAAAGKGATISITLSYPPQADHSVSLSVNSDTGDYTLKVLGSAGISCENEHCSLLIPAGQTLAQLSVLTGTDISLSIVASDGEFVVRVEVTAPVVEAPPVANFVGSSNVIYGSDAAAGKGATISITLSYPPPADHLVSLSVNSDTGDYTIKVLGSAGISCENEHCSLLIPEGQTLAQLSVLTGTDISLSIVASDGEFVVRVYDEWPVCLRTQQVRDDIMSQAGKSDCAKVTSADLANINAIYLYDSGITSLQHGDFDGLVNLQELDLESNNLTTLPSGVFDSLVNLQELLLKKNALTTLPSDVFSGLGSLQALDLESNNLTTLPSGVFGSLVNLQELLLKKNALTVLSSGVFSGLGSLQGLALSQNTLTTLPSGVFSGLVTLQRLGLSQNALTTLPSGAFDGLDKLQRIGLYSNALTDLPSGVFGGLNDLEFLRLDGNNLTDLPSNVFGGLDSLQELYLNGNKFTALPSDVFDSLGNLQYLRLSSNDLVALPSDVFDDLGNLQWLYLHRNALTTLADGVFDDLVNLQELHLYRNALTTLADGVFDGLGNLQELHLYRNALTTLPDGVFDGLVNLQELAVSYNTLTVLPDGVFDGLGNLQKLYLNNNALAALPRGMFDHLGNLEFLYLNNNECSFANQRSNLGIADPAYVTFGSGNGCLALFDAPPLPAIAGLPYALYNMAAQGGVGNHTYNIIGGNDSNYFALDINTGELSITTSQSQVGQYTLTIQVADGDGITQTAVATVHIASQQQTPQMAGFVGTVALLEKSKAAAGEGAMIDIAALYPVQSDSFTVSLAVDGGSGNYTLTATGVGLSCQNGQCSLVIPQGQREVQLSVLTQTDLSLFITAGGSGTLVVDVVDILPVCDRTPQIRDEIVQRAGKSACDMVTVDDLIQINQIEVARQGITLLQPRDFSGLDNLQGLNLLGNSLTVLLSGVFDGLSNLRHLDLGTNDLTEVSVGVFDDLVHLQHLHLNGNALTTLSYGVFNSLRNVLHIDLSNNALTTLPFGIFDHLDSLEYLHLQNNDLVNLPYNVFGNLSSLQSLYLGGNLDSCAFEFQILGIGDAVYVDYGC